MIVKRQKFQPTNAGFKSARRELGDVEMSRRLNGEASRRSTFWNWVFAVIGFLALIPYIMSFIF